MRIKEIKRMKYSDLTSDSWEELEEKLKKVKWKGIPIIYAKRIDREIVVTRVFEIPICADREN